MNRALTFIKSVTRSIGLEIRFYNIHSSEFLHLARLLFHHNIETIIDVGANIGQYAMNIRDAGYKGRIISFEPLSAAYRQLKRNGRRDKGWTIADRMALGNRDGETEINISANSVSSSILPMMDSHKKAARDSAYIGKERVTVRRLDSLLPDLDLAGNVFMKIDVQGFEIEVLNGASQFLSMSRGLQIELSLVELYAGQMSMENMINLVSNLGFELYALFPGFVDNTSGRMLQVDGIFFRKTDEAATTK